VTDRDKLDQLAETVAEYLGIDPELIQVDYRSNQLCFRPVDVMVLLASARKADVELLDDEDESIGSDLETFDEKDRAVLNSSSHAAAYNKNPESRSPGEQDMAEEYFGALLRSGKEFL
jgi:hypothetical protein